MLVLNEAPVIVPSERKSVAACPQLICKENVSMRSRWQLKDESLVYRCHDRVTGARVDVEKGGSKTLLVGIGKVAESQVSNHLAGGELPKVDREIGRVA